MTLLVRAKRTFIEATSKLDWYVGLLCGIIMKPAQMKQVPSKASIG